MIIITAHWKALPGKELALQNCLEEMVKQVRLEEEDCLEYILHQDVNDKSRFFFYEQYNNAAAFEFHKTTDHFKNLISTTKDLIDGEVEVKMFSLVI